MSGNLGTYLHLPMGLICLFCLGYGVEPEKELHWKVQVDEVFPMQNGKLDP